MKTTRLIAMFFVVTMLFVFFFNIEIFGDELIDTYLYKPEEIARLQEELGITKEQKKDLISIVNSAQNEINALEWNLHEEEKRMETLLASSDTDSSTLFKHAEKILSIESAIKMKHLKALVRIKNELTQHQIELLQENKK